MKNKKGFTLIELLAVITIMGILMLVAIPAVSRTIENTRRQTFANTALQYIKSFKNEVYQDQVRCYNRSTSTTEVASALPPGYYFYMFDSGTSTGRDLMEQGGTSSWGGARVRGVISMYKPANETDNEGQKSDVEYAIFITDSVGRGIGRADTINYFHYNNSNNYNSVSSNNYWKAYYFVTEKSIKRSSVGTKTKENSYPYYNSTYDNRKTWYDHYNDNSNYDYSGPSGFYNNGNGNYTYFEGSVYSNSVNNNANPSPWGRCTISS